MKNLYKLLLIIFIFVTFSCAKTEKVPTAESAYIKAVQLLKDKSYNEAAKEFEKIEDDFPFSKWAAKAQTMAAYAFYKDEEYAEVARVVDDFIRINPSSDAGAYMIYIKALSYYNQIPEINRAQDNTKEASLTFRELNARFPNSQYYEDVKEKLAVVDEHLAGSKMAIGRYQISQENYIGAIKNFQYVAQRYTYTDQAAEAYYRLFEIYSKLGIKNEAEKSYENLRKKFPQTNWMKLAQNILEKD